MDTPGFSQLRFDFLMPADVGLLFREIAEIQKQYGACKFSDCIHEHETGCKIQEHPEIMDRLEVQLLDTLKKDDTQKEPEIPEEDISEIMDLLVDDDGVILE